VQHWPPSQVPPAHGVPAGAGAVAQLPAVQLSVVQGRPSLQLVHGAPPLPQAALAVPGWQAVPFQQPAQQAPDWQSPPVQAVPSGLLPPVHWPAAHRPVAHSPVA
jgi:hypothetical protein